MTSLIGCILIILSVRIINALEEGSLCNIHDGTRGRCTVDRSCQWAIEKLTKKELTRNQLVRCGLKGTSSVICCKDETIKEEILMPVDQRTIVDGFVFNNGPDNDRFVPTTAAVTVPPPPPPEPLKTTRKSEQACQLIKDINALRIDYHILNGVGADIGEFPHMSAIGFSDEVEEQKYSFDCGGSLISKNFVLTAAHCANNRNRQPKIVRIGRTSIDLTNEEDLGPPQDIVIKKVHLNPKYSSRKKYNDIALIELATFVEYTPVVRPACLYSSSLLIDDTKVLQITGWGRVDTSTHAKSTWLLKANISEVPLSKCQESYKSIQLSQLSEGLVQSQLCATSSIDGKIIDACQGDSGGPIQFKIQVKQDDIFYIVGVTSFGASCGSDIPGIYTRVSEYLDWIEKVVWPEAVSI